MITTPLSFHEKAKGQVIDLVSKLYISFDKERYKPTFPEDFQEIEYIQSTGTQYVDTGFCPDQDSSVEVEYKMNSFPQQYNAPYGTRVSNTKQLQVIHADNNNARYDFRYGNKDTYIQNGKDITTRRIVKQDKNICYIDGTQVVAITANAFDTTYPMYLFATNAENSANFISAMTLYNAKLSDNGTTVRSFVPAISKTKSINLLKRQVGNEGASSGVTWRRLADRIIAVSGTSTANWTNIYGETTFDENLPAGTYTFSIKNSLPYSLQLRLRRPDNTLISTYIPANETSVTFTTDTETTKSWVFYSCPTGTATRDEVVEPMLVAGSEKKPYEPYYATGTVGLYDLATGRFYVNSGTGTFTAGQPVEHTGIVDYFTLDKSVLNGIDRLDSSDNNPIQLWDTYSYYDFSDRIISASIERSIEFPYGTQCAMADVTLNNFDRYFDPANSISPIAENNLPSRPLKLFAGYRGETVVPQFVGLTQQMPVMNGNGTVSYHAVDFLSEIASQTLNSTIAMRNARTDQVLAKIVEQFGVTSLQYNFEAGTNVIPFVFFDKGENAGEAIQKLIQAEGGKFWLDEMGILRFERRNSLNSEAVMTMSEYDVISVEPSGISDIINRVKISCELREVQEYQTVYSKNSTGDSTSNLWVIGAGQSIVRECRLEDPCYDVVNPTLGKNSAVSYFTAKNSAQQEVSSGIIAVGELSTNSYTITFTNANLFPVEIDEVQLWGEPAKVYDVLDYDAYEDESVEKYGEQVLEITDNKFFQSFNQAQAYAVYLLNDRAKYNSTIKLQVKGDFSLQLGDAFELQGDYAGSYRIDAITWSLSNNSFVYTIKAHRFEPMNYFVLDQSILDGDDVLA